MTDNLLQEDGWQPLTGGGGEDSSNPIKIREKRAAQFPSGMIRDAGENSPPEEQVRGPYRSTPRPIIACEDGWQPLCEGGEEASCNGDARGNENTQFPPEMTEEWGVNSSEEQRQSLRQKIPGMSTPDKFRLAIRANREVRSLLIHDPKRIIALAVLKNQRIDETEIVQYAQRKDLSEDVISAISKDPKWKKSYPMKLALVNNPKTPLSMSINLLDELQAKDLKLLARGKDVPPVLKQKAREIFHQRNIR
jgi:hypothetical protein